MTLIGENTLDNKFSVYPIPSENGNINIHFKYFEDVKLIELYAINGSRIASIENPKIRNNQFVLKNIAKGIFILKATIGNNLITKKVVIN